MNELATGDLNRKLPLRYGGLLGTTLEGASTDTGWYRVVPDGVAATRVADTGTEVMLDDLRSDMIGISLSGWHLWILNDGYEQAYEILSTEGNVVTLYQSLKNGTPDTGLRYVLVPVLVIPFRIGFKGNGRLEVGQSGDIVVPGLSGFSREVISGDMGTPTIIPLRKLTSGTQVRIPATDVTGIFYRFTEADDGNVIEWGE